MALLETNSEINLLLEQWEKEYSNNSSSPLNILKRYPHFLSL